MCPDMTHLPASNHANQARLSVVCLSMIRNEVDIIGAFLEAADHLFDSLTIVDMQSTDGTREVIQKFKLQKCRLTVYNFAIKAKYQAQIMRTLAQKAAKDGADWIFLLDADEFLDMDGRNELEEYLKGVRSDFMYMPWINLVPERYGSYSDFDVNQHFYWSGRASKYSKVAVSGGYILKNPGFVIGNGNHRVSASAVAQPERPPTPGLALLHVPVRSPERTRYKAENAISLQANKHNQNEGEGSHHAMILELLSLRGVGDHILNAVAADYGCDTYFGEELDPEELGWPRKGLPFSDGKSKVPSLDAFSLAEVLRRESRPLWQTAGFVKDSPVKAIIDAADIRLVPQVVSGRGEYRDSPFQSLPAIAHELPTDFGPSDIVECITASLMPPQCLTFSAWSRLSPVLFCLFALVRPRRYVELGVHNGMSFFAACQASEAVGTQTECVAVDSWLGDAHASFHSPSVFADFKTNLKDDYPDQYYLHAFFDDALACFEPESIDLLHIDGFHSYEAVKKDYLAWLPKMSAQGVMMFHDINVHERGFGVWRLWDEIKERHPTISFMHSHGLGMAYVGGRSGRVAELFELITHSGRVWLGVAQHYFETVGPVMIDYAREKASGTSKREQKLEKEFGRILDSKWWKATGPLRRWSNGLRKLRGRRKKRWPRTVADV
jgi:hypothetical protein